MLRACPIKGGELGIQESAVRIQNPEFRIHYLSFKLNHLALKHFNTSNFKTSCILYHISNILNLITTQPHPHIPKYPPADNPGLHK